MYSITDSVVFMQWILAKEQCMLRHTLLSIHAVHLSKAILPATPQLSQGRSFGGGELGCNPPKEMYFLINSLVQVL